MDFTKALCLTPQIIGKRVIELWRALQSRQVRGLEAVRPVQIVMLVVRSLLVSKGVGRCHVEMNNTNKVQVVSSLVDEDSVVNDRKLSSHTEYFSPHPEL